MSQRYSPRCESADAADDVSQRRRGSLLRISGATGALVRPLSRFHQCFWLTISSQSGHHRLFVYSFVLKHKQKMGATQQELLPIVMDCLKAALAVVKHVVKDLERGSKLRSMINNIASM